MLGRAGYEVEVALSGAQALARCASSPPRLIVMDYDMPDLDAIDVLARLAADHIRIPVIVLTGARLSSADQVLVFDRGAVDYVVKGTDRQVLLARVRNALRTDREHGSPGAIMIGALAIDLAAGQATLGARPLHLRPRTLEVLHQLAIQHDRVVSREQLLDAIWGTDYAGFRHSVDQAIYEIRKEATAELRIETIPRRGYRLVV